MNEKVFTTSDEDMGVSFDHVTSVSYDPKDNRFYANEDFFRIVQLGDEERKRLEIKNENAHSKERSALKAMNQAEEEEEIYRI